MDYPIDTGLVAEHNATLRANLDADYAALGGMLQRRGLDIEKITMQAQNKLPRNNSLISFLELWSHAILIACASSNPNSFTLSSRITNF